MRSDSLVPLLTPPPSPNMGFRQGTVVSFNLDTGANVIDVGGTQLVDLPCLNVTDAAGLLPGMVVGLLTWKSSWWIIGRVAVPGTSGFADLTIRAADGGEVSFVDGEIRFKRGTVENETAGQLFASGEDDRLWSELRPPFASGVSDDNAIIVEGGNPDGSIPGDIFLITAGEFHADADQTLHVNVGETADYASVGTTFIDAGGEIQLISGDNQVFIDHVTTSNAANCFISDFGQIVRSTSARRFKLDVADLEVDPAAVLRLRPRTWRDRTEVELDPDTEHRIPGFIAEEVAEAGLGEFVTYDHAGEVESIAYDRLSAALLAVLRQQEQRLAVLERAAGIAPPEPPGPVVGGIAVNRPAASPWRPPATHRPKGRTVGRVTRPT